ncbi:hypothetical protein MBLNU459_g3409t2 [Dothideomycetes sp. NU459]
MATEQTPLLRSRSASVSEMAEGAEKRVMAPRTIVAIVIWFLLIVQFGSELTESPFIRIVESIYCYEYWEIADPSKLLAGRDTVRPGAMGGVEERWCKVAKIQSQVASLRGWQTFLDGIPSLLLAIPFGIIADKYGRKPILTLAMCSFPLRLAWLYTVCWFWQSFDIRMTWLSSLHSLLGGSSAVASALFYCVVSDVTNVNDRASRFFALMACSLCASFVSNPIVAYLMIFNPWIPMLAGLVLMILPLPLIAILPETLNYRHPLLDVTGPSPVVGEDPSSSTSTPAPTTTTIWSRCGALLVEATHFAIKDWRVGSLSLTFLLHYLTNNSAVTLMVQYASTRYGLSLSRATLLLTVRSGAMVVVLLVLLPAATQHLLTQRRFTGQQKDLALARASAVVMVAGLWLLALAPTVAAFVAALLILTLGIGFVSLVRSFMTSLVPAGDVAKMYAIIGVVDTLGLMAGSPLLAFLFQAGFNIGGRGGGGAGLGLPFWALGGMYVLAGVLLFSIRIGEKEASAEEGDDASAGS